MFWSRPGPRTPSAKIGAACQGEGRPNEDRSNPSHGSGPTCRGLAAVDRTDRGDHVARLLHHASIEIGPGSNVPLPSPASSSDLEPDDHSPLFIPDHLTVLPPLERFPAFSSPPDFEDFFHPASQFFPARLETIGGPTTLMQAGDHVGDPGFRFEERVDGSEEVCV
jgi:hypothetical protein